MKPKEPKFSIGQQYRTRGKASHICTVTDIWKTYNAAGDLVKVRYVATHEFMGQQVEDCDVCETTILMSLAFSPI